MKYCKDCKRELTNRKFSYKDGICYRCVTKRKYRAEHPEFAQLLKELSSKTREELIRVILSYRGNRARNSMLFAQKNYQIRHTRMRLFKIRNQIDYLL